MLTREQMENEVQEELAHIPESSGPQNELRSAFYNMRMHSLGMKAEKKQSAKEVLISSIDIVQKDHPGFKFTFDKEFFNQRD